MQSQLCVALDDQPTLEKQLVGLLSASDVVRTALCDEISEVSYDDDEDELD